MAATVYAYRCTMVLSCRYIRTTVLVTQSPWFMAMYWFITAGQCTQLQRPRWELRPCSLSNSRESALRGRRLYPNDSADTRSHVVNQSPTGVMNRARSVTTKQCHKYRSDTMFLLLSPASRYDAPQRFCLRAAS